ncbi:MAG: helix-turn-helix domain-containing protein [Bacteroidetes bacterium]|nr:helix-turn-helix domain-containing protein [Bacteroidota bacterium]
MNDLSEMLRSLQLQVAAIHTRLDESPSNTVDQFSNNWLDGQDVMQMLHISKRTLQNLRDSKTLPFSRVNGKFFYKLSDIESILESNYSTPKSRRYARK